MAAVVNPGGCCTLRVCAGVVAETSCSVSRVDSVVKLNVSTMLAGLTPIAWAICSCAPVSWHTPFSVAFVMLGQVAPPVARACLDVGVVGVRHRRIALGVLDAIGEDDQITVARGAVRAEELAILDAGAGHERMQRLDLEDRGADAVEFLAGTDRIIDAERQRGTGDADRRLGEVIGHHRHDDDRGGGEARRVERAAEVLADHRGRGETVESVDGGLVGHHRIGRLDIDGAVGRAGEIQIRRVGQHARVDLEQCRARGRRRRRCAAAGQTAAAGVPGTHRAVSAARAGAQQQRGRDDASCDKSLHIAATPKSRRRCANAQPRGAASFS